MVISEEIIIGKLDSVLQIVELWTSKLIKSHTENNLTLNDRTLLIFFFLTTLAIQAVLGKLLDSVSIKVVDSGGWPKRLQRFHAALHYNQYTIFFPLANTTRLASSAQKIINVSI